MVGEPLLFRGLAPEIVDEVRASARKRRFRSGETVFHEGDPGESMQVIETGHFALRITTVQGVTYMNRVYGPGDVFGRMAVGPITAIRSMTVVSLDDSETLELFRTQLDALRAAHPVVNDSLLGIAGMELMRVSERLLESLYVDADRRVRRRLLELGNQYRDPDTGLTVIPLTQENIAAMAGTSRATVSRVLREEQQYGSLAKRRRTIALLNPAEIARRAAWPGETYPAAVE